MTRPYRDQLRAAFVSIAPSSGFRAILPGVAALAVAAELFAWLGPAAVDRRITAQVAQIITDMDAEDAALRRRLRAEAPAASTRGIDPMSFLRELRVSPAHGTPVITRVLPRLHDPRTLDVELLASFPAFLDLAADAERLGGRLDDVRLRAAEPTTEADGDGVARQLIAFSLEVPLRITVSQPDTTPPAPGKSAHTGRDPFEPPAGHDGGPLAHHLLTGITAGASGSTATIDDRDYAVGDRLDDMTVAAIGATEVDLARGTRHFRLRLGGSGLMRLDKLAPSGIP